jgi:two-component system, NarL family, nitrate/nitrite response regulator NarL
VLTARSARPSSEPANLLHQLTEREQQILRLVGNGCTNGEIAGILSLAETTVKNTMTTILQKLHVRNRVEAAILANRASQSSFEHSSTLDPL